MNIKRMSRVLVLAVMASTAGSAVAFDFNAKKEAFINMMRSAGTKTAEFVTEHKMPIGVGAVAVAGVSLAVWKYFHDKKVAKKPAKTTKKKSAVRAARTRRVARSVRNNRTNSARRTMKRCRGGVCSLR